MNILLISRCPPYPLHLGDRLIVYHLARELHRRGHVIDLLAFSDRMDDLADRYQYAGFFRDVFLLPEPVRSQRSYMRRWLGVQRRFPSHAQAAWSPDMWRLIARMISERAYDVAHLFGGVQVYEFARLAAELPNVITPYESYALYLKRQYAAQPTLRRRIELHAARGFERFMFAPFDAAVVLSEPDRAELLRADDRLDVRVIPNGIDLDYWRNPHPNSAAVPRERDTLIFTGNYDYAPNQDAARRLITRILPLVRQHIPDAKAWIVGNAPPRDLAAWGADRVAITGRVPDVRPYLARASVFVSPLAFGAGIKNKILEAMAMGCPVAATPLSMDGIAITPGHDVLIESSDEALAAAAVRLLRDPAYAMQLGANAQRLIETRYSWGQVAAAYEALYEEVQGRG
ncbi:MAG: glycosyltransferase [bacterium]|nr:glycosyltransferase [bacterium]